MRGLDVLYNHTNPIKPHEAAIVSSILRIHTGEHFWRFEKQLYCPGCRRELTVLDYFLTALRHHSVDFIIKEICPDYEVGGTCDHEADAINVDRIDLVEHPIAINCTACGGVFERQQYVIYSHPGCKGNILRMPATTFDRLCAQARITA